MSLRRFYLSIIVVDLAFTLSMTTSRSMPGVLVLIALSSLWFFVGWWATDPQSRRRLAVLWVGHAYFTLSMAMSIFHVLQDHDPRFTIVCTQAALLALSNILLILLSVSRSRATPTQPV